MVSRWLGAVVGLVVAGIATAAQAVPLVDEGINTFDPNTGLRWLDVTATVGMSYGAVLGSTYVTDLGYQFATADQLIELYDNAGGDGDYYLTASGPRSKAENYQPAILLLSLMGCTSYILGQACDGAEQDWHIAMYGPPPNGGIPTLSYFG